MTIFQSQNGLILTSPPAAMYTSLTNISIPKWSDFNCLNTEFGKQNADKFQSQNGLILT